MPINLFSVPDHIQNSVIEKFNVFDFIKFHESSQKAFNASLNVNTRYIIEGRENEWLFTDAVRVDFNYTNQALGIKVCDLNNANLSHLQFRTDFCDFPVRFQKAFGFIETQTLSEEFCNSLISFLLNTNSSIVDMKIRGIECSPETLCKFIEISKVKKLIVNQLLPHEFSTFGAIRNVTEMKTSHFVDESVILSLEHIWFDIKFSNLTSTGANLILKDLLSGEMKMKYCNIGTNRKLNRNIILSGIPVRSLQKDSDGRLWTYFGDKIVYGLFFSDNSICIREQLQTEE